MSDVGFGMCPTVRTDCELRMDGFGDEVSVRCSKCRTGWTARLSKGADVGWFGKNLTRAEFNALDIRRHI